ncbi:Protein DENND6B [Smittium mucronatum]|uniref:Protein DENND6B n=1 Tax=Smittium mucronatum TaxID=133383 RepID=A0A1R0GYW9_9FUNG|nr:Protein DENND6B [Smittium mucronatum]
MKIVDIDQKQALENFNGIKISSDSNFISPNIPSNIIKNEDLEFDFQTPLNFKKSETPILLQESQKLNNSPESLGFVKNSVPSLSFNTPTFNSTQFDQNTKTKNISVKQKSILPKSILHNSSQDVFKRANRVLSLLANGEVHNSNKSDSLSINPSLVDYNSNNLKSPIPPVIITNLASGFSSNGRNFHNEVPKKFDFLNNKQSLKRIQNWIISIAIVKFDENVGPVILSTSPEIVLIEFLGPSYSDRGMNSIFESLKNISLWSPPGSSQSDFDFLGKVMHVDFPISHNSQFIETSSFGPQVFSPKKHILASVIPDGLLYNFRNNLPDLYLCWELMILAETLVVFSDSPSRCFEVVYGLVDIIKPIFYCGDYRPYFTLQDPDFSSIVSPLKVPSNTIIGVSNPFFKQAVSHWPNKLILDSASRIQKINSGDKPLVIASLPFRKKNPNLNQSGNLLSQKSLLGTSLLNSSSPSKNDFGLKTKHKKLVPIDQDFLNEVESGLSGTLGNSSQQPWILSNSLRLHFADLTDQFLTPLNRYFTTLIPPLPSKFVNITHLQGSLFSVLTTMPPPLNRWRNKDFFFSLMRYGLPSGLSGKHTTASKASAAASAIAAAIFKPSSDKNSSQDRKINSRRHFFDPSNPPPSITIDSGVSKSVNHIKSNSRPIVSSEWKDFYGRFLKCGNFVSWLQKRISDSNDEMWKQFFDVVADCDIEDLIKDNTPIIFFNKLNEVSRALSIKDHTSCQDFTGFPSVSQYKIEHESISSMDFNSRNLGNNDTFEIKNSHKKQHFQSSTRSNSPKKLEADIFFSIPISSTVSADPRLQRDPLKNSGNGKALILGPETDKDEILLFQSINDAHNMRMTRSDNPSAQTSPMLLKTDNQSSIFPNDDDLNNDLKIAVLGSGGNLVGYIKSADSTPKRSMNNDSKAIFQSNITPAYKSHSWSNAGNDSETHFDISNLATNDNGVLNIKSKSTDNRNFVESASNARNGKFSLNAQLNPYYHLQSNPNKLSNHQSDNLKVLQNSKNHKEKEESDGLQKLVKCIRSVSELIELADYFASILQIKIICNCEVERPENTIEPNTFFPKDISEVHYSEFDNNISSDPDKNPQSLSEINSIYPISDEERSNPLNVSGNLKNSQPLVINGLDTMPKTPIRNTVSRTPILKNMTDKSRLKIFQHLVFVIRFLPLELRKRYNIH